LGLKPRFNKLGELVCALRRIGVDCSGEDSFEEDENSNKL
jgi:hypothetical protein